MSMGLCPTRASGAREPRYYSKLSKGKTFLQYMYVYILIFLTKRALDFAAKLNSGDIQNCNCF